MYQNESLYVFTGGPGSGKTSVINELQKRGYCCADEVARQIIQQEVKKGGDALPWRNTVLYTSYMLSGSIDLYRKYFQSKSPVFFDRGIPDSLAYAQLTGLEDLEVLWEASHNYRYNKKVFLFPPWSDIYCADEERKQSFQEAEKTFEVIGSVYENLGYQLIYVPLLPVLSRVSFIIKEVRNISRTSLL